MYRRTLTTTRVEQSSRSDCLLLDRKILATIVGETAADCINATLSLGLQSTTVVAPTRLPERQVHEQLMVGPTATPPIQITMAPPPTRLSACLLKRLP